MIPNDKLLRRFHLTTREALLEIAEVMGTRTVYEAVKMLIDAKFTTPMIAEKFDISYETMRRVVMRVQPEIFLLRGDNIAATRSARHGLRLRDGTPLRDHCLMLGINSSRSAAYQNERKRLARQGLLLTAENYRRTLKTS